MPDPAEHLTIDNLVCASVPNTISKIEDFRRAGASLVQVVFDFDRTLTVSQPGTTEDITTWHILGKHLPPAGQDRYQALFRHYRALELDGTLDEVHSKTWASSVLDLFVTHQVNMTEVEQDFLSKAGIRPGTKELFDLCATHNIPTVILSAGIKQVIDLWTHAYNIAPSIVLSTDLQISTDGSVHGWDEESLIHMLNKIEVGHPELQRIRAERTNTILIGDSLNDADMADGTDSVLRIRIHDPRADEKQSSQTIRDQTFHLFDAMIETGSLQPVQQLVKYIVG